jgi:hypothetical protein
MATVENTYALTDLERVKKWAGIVSGDDDDEITRVINEVSAEIEGRCGRQFISRTYTHDGDVAGGNLPRLDSFGGTRLWLPQLPVTSVTTLKVYPTHSALTEGYDEDFVIGHDEGMIELVNGNGFYRGRQLVEITYVAGYLTAPGETQGWAWGWNVDAAEIQEAATVLSAFRFNQKNRQREGIASISEGGATVSYFDSIRFVDEILERHTLRR